MYLMKISEDGSVELCFYDVNEILIRVNILIMKEAQKNSCNKYSSARL